MARDDLVARSRTLVLAVSIALVGILTALVLTLVAAVLVGLLGIEIDIIMAVVLTLALTAGVAFGGVSLAYLSWRGLGWSFIGVRLPTPRDLAWVGGGYLLAFLGVFLASLGVGLAGGEPASNQVSELGFQAPTLLLLLVPISLFLVGPGEELLFRGVVQGTLRQSFGPAGAVVLSSAIFASVHYVALTGGASARLTTIAILFLPSLVFGAAYERTDNLVVPALIHGLYNSTLAVLLYVALRFADVPAPTALLG